MSLASRPLFVLEAEVSQPVSVGDPGGGERRYIPIGGGWFKGDDLSGKVLPGGADWQTVLPDGAIELYAHYALQTESGSRIEVTSEGLRSGPPEVLAQLAQGILVDPSLYYFRTVMRFRTGDPALARWNTLMGIAVGERRQGLVHLDVYEIL